MAPMPVLVSALSPIICQGKDDVMTHTQWQQGCYRAFRPFLHVSGPLWGICMKLSIDNCCKFNGFMLLSQALSQGLRGCSSFSRCLNRQTLSGSTGALQKAVQVKLGLKDRLHPTIC